MSTKTAIKSLDRLEQVDFRVDQSRALVEVTSDLLSDALEPLIRHLDQRFDTIDKRFDVIDQRFDVMDQRFISLNEMIDQRFKSNDKCFEALESHIRGFYQRERISLAILIIGFVGVITAILTLPIIR